MTAREGQFTEQLWKGIEPIYAAILAHPFLSGLTDGGLPRDRFAFYVVQDALYLRSFSRALSSLAAIAPDGESTRMFNRHASDAIAVEESLHDGFLAELGLHPEQVETVEPSPTNRAYCDFLSATTIGRPFHEGLAAVLPCYWIYQRVGQQLLPAGSPEPLYRRWLETYGGDEFDDVVRDVLSLTDRIAPELTEGQRGRMQALFDLGSRYEWMFWDSAWRLERWPV